MATEAKLDLILEKLDKMDDRMENMEGRMENMEGRMENMEGRMENMEGRMENMEGRIEKLEEQGEELAKNVRLMQLQIENEIAPNIQRVAEGHLDITRNVMQSSKLCGEVEMMSVRMRVVESAIDKINSKLSA